jgi:hypothetical protein
VPYQYSEIVAARGCIWSNSSWSAGHFSSDPENRAFFIPVDELITFRSLGGVSLRGMWKPRVSELVGQNSLIISSRFAYSG